jgi:catechol 2,3-dioxygenase-like lactoylglutathione lyase family enzyme
MSPTMNVIDVVVSDIEAAIAFYRRLGLEFVVDAQMPGHAGCDTSNGLHVMLDTDELRDKTSLGWSRPTGGGGPRTFLSFEFDSPSDVDAKYAELTDAGYRGQQEPWNAFWGMRYASVLDPDGNGVDLYATLRSG